MRQFKKLEAWKAARTTATEAYRATMQQPLARHLALADQIRRAACSIPANLAEGYGLGTTRQLIRCTHIALGSAYELDAHLDLAVELSLLPAASQATLSRQVKYTIGLLIGLLRGLSKKVGRMP